MKPLSGRQISALIQQRLQALAPSYRQRPPDDAHPLLLAGHTAGWVSRPVREAIARCPGVQSDDTMTHILPPGSYASLSLQCVLQTVAETLAQAGCLRAWRNEQIDVLAEGHWLASLERAAMRPLGLRTRAVHLNAWSEQGGLWVARRAATKAIDPGLWDTTVAGLVSAGETDSLALTRESLEEAGLHFSGLTPRAPLRTVLRLSRRIPEGYQVEDILVADCVLPAGTLPVNQDGEVSKFECLTTDELAEWLVQGKFTLEAELAILHGLRRCGLAESQT